MFGNFFCEYFGTTDGFTVDWIVVCGKGVFLLCGIVSGGWMGETLCCIVVGIVSTISLLLKCDGV